MDIRGFKEHFSHKKGHIHFNNSGQAPIPDVNRNLHQKWLDRFFDEGAHCSLEGWNQTEVTRQKLAHFLGADVEEVSFFQTTASALSQAALGIELKPGDEILTWDQEYPSNFYPWRMAAEKSGARVRIIESEAWATPFEKILSQVTEKTKVVALSWVQYQSGAMSDLKAIDQALRERNIWTVADVIQGAGVYPFNFHDSGFDIICGGSHKWLCSGFGGGYMLLRKEKRELLRPLEFGAMSFGLPDTEKSFAIALRPDGRRFEPGSKAMIEIIAMSATLDLFEKYGIQNISNEAVRLATRLRDGFKANGIEVISPPGAIVNAVISETAQKKLAAAHVSFAPRGPGVRFSLHAFNHDFEVEQVLEIIKKS
jgi:selenocysteine lyase/cysteine desulfurase